MPNFLNLALMYNFRLCKFLQGSFSVKKFEIRLIIVSLVPVELFR